MAQQSVTVVLTTFNHGDLIVQALESVLDQSRPADEIVVVDDGSSDGTKERLAGRFGSRINYVYQENGGIASSRNRGVAESGGDLVVLMDGDDLWHTRKLEFQSAAFAAHPESGIIAVRVNTFDSVSEVPDLRSEIVNPSVTSANRFAEVVTGSFLLTTSQVAMPRRVLEEVGPSDQRYPLCSDLDLYCRIAVRHPVTWIEAPLAYWRYHPTSASGPEILRQLRWGPEVLEVLGAAEDRETGQRAVVHDARRRRALELGWHAMQACKSGEQAAARPVVRGLVAGFPHVPKFWGYLAVSEMPRWMAEGLLGRLAGR